MNNEQATYVEIMRLNYTITLKIHFVLQSGYQRQGGKEKDRKRDRLGEREREREREKDITRGDRIL